jgi:hypothetical protein
MKQKHKKRIRAISKRSDPHRELKPVLTWPVPGPGASYEVVKDFVLGLYADRPEPGACRDCSSEHLVSHVLHGVRTWRCRVCGKENRVKWLFRNPTATESAMTWLEPVIDTVVKRICQKTALPQATADDWLNCADPVIAQSMIRMLGLGL